MPQIDTLRPNATGGLNDWTVVGAANAHTALSDDSDSTYIESANPFTANDATLLFPSHTPAADHERHRARVRIRASAPGTGTILFAATDLPQASFGPTTGPQSTAAAWGSFPALGDAGAQTYWGGAGRFARIQALSGDALRGIELYIDIDTRNKPTFTADVYDFGGTSRDGGTISDTNRAELAFEDLDYDGLTARNWRAFVTDDATGAIVYDTGTLGDIQSGQPPGRLLIDPLPNGNYTASLFIRSTIRNNDGFISDIEQVTFEIDFTPPVPPILTVTEDGCAGVGPRVELCWAEDSPGAVTFDDDPVIEIIRTDCRGQESVYVGGPVEGCHCDRFITITEPGFFCGERATQALRLIGSGNGRAQTPDNASISITGDIEIYLDVALQTWTNMVPTSARLLRKSGSYAVDVGNWEEGNSRLIFIWVEGSTSVAVRSTEGLDFDPGQRVKLRITHDVNDGAGSRVTTFYYDTGDGWVRLGDPVVFGTAGSIDDSGNALEFGSASTPQPPVGYFYALELYDGIGGTLVANPDFTDASQGWALGDNVGDTGTDPQGNVWTISGFTGPEIALESCLVSYRARYWGEVNGALVATDWDFAEASVLENPNPGDDWLRGLTFGDLAFCPDRSYGRSRPFGAFQPIGGGLPTVVTGAPGGRNYTLEIPVTSEADLVTLEEILAQPLVFYQPSDQADLWLAPDIETVEVVPVGRIRTLTVSLVAVEPQPVASPESFFT